jgi:DNA-binding NtrC family response regulator
MSEKAQTVLILDDDEVVRESLVNFFEDREWRVLSAVTAEDALDTLKHESADGAIVDIRLPGMNGDAFMRAVGEAHPTLACVICTGSPEYRTPKTVAALPQVSEKMFTKPVPDLAALEDELHRQIEKCMGMEIEHG